MTHLLETVASKFEITSGATDSMIEKLDTHFSLEFPNDYKEFLQFTNGLEGPTGDNYIVLWSVDEVIQLNRAYHVTEFVPNMIIFGSDGADEAFALDTTNMTIVNFPFIGMGQIDSQKIAETFEDFLSSQIN
jgi:hypothetical protein